MAISPALKQLMQQKANKFKTSGDRARKPKEGRNVVRIIAPKPGEVSWVKEEMGIYRELGVHWIKPSESAKPIAVVGSSEICYGQVSSVAAAVEMAVANAYDEEMKKVYESWRARASVLVNMIDRSDGSVDIWELPKGVWGKIMELWNLYAEQDYDIFDHNTGLDIAITRTGKGLNTKYDVAAMPMMPGHSFTPVTPDQVASAADLDNYIQVNFFRGEEPKALNAISQIAGVVVPALGAPATPTPALTSPAASVAGAELTAPQIAPAPVAPAAVDPAFAAALAAQQAAAMAAAQPAAQPVVQPVVAPEIVTAAPLTPTTTLDGLSTDQQDELFRQLSQIG